MNRPWKNRLLNFKPGAKDMGVFLGCSALMALRIPLPIEATSNFTYNHPLLSLITLFPVLAWLTGAYVLGAIGLVISITRFALAVFRRRGADAVAKEDPTPGSQ
jgi:hypothetical protein